MTNSIEARFDMENTTVLKGLGFPHPCRISHSEAWENIATAAKWFQNDLDLQALESEIFSLQRSSLVTDVIEEAVRKKRKPDFLDLFKALQAEPECYSWVTKLMKIALQQFRVIRDHLNSKCLTSIIVFDIKVRSSIQ